MKKYRQVLLLLFVIAFNSGCPKPCIDVSYSFKGNVQITPDKDSIRIGDTIFLVSVFPTKLIDQLSGQLIDYSDASNIGSDMGVFSIPVGDSVGRDAVNNFKYISLVGRIYNYKSIGDRGGFQQLSYEQADTNYVLKAEIIPQVSGNYVFSVSNGVGYGGKKNSCN